MSKFNSPNTIKTVNHEGHVAYSMTAKSKLVTQVLTSFFNEKKFYGDNSNEIKETILEVIKTDPEFVSKLAVFARRVFNMRSIAHVLTGYLAHEVNGKPFVRDTVRGITVRGDDVTELLAFYISEFGKPIPNSLKKGIGDAMKNFDEYTLAKYKGSGKGVKMRDILCLCRPKPTSKEQEALWKRCLEGKLATPKTWETELSAKGNKKEVWEDLIASKSIGYMAMLRNLRNILEANPDNLSQALLYISNPSAVRNSKQLPFRFLSAYKSVQKISSSAVLTALELAVDASVDNLPKIPGKTVIAIDVSGSMTCGNISGNSNVCPMDIAIMLGLIANRICEDAIVYTFDHRVRRMAIPSNSGILSSVMNFREYGGGTNMSLPFDAMLKERVKADRIIVLSDNECNGWWGTSTIQANADKYRLETGNDIWVHAVDLEGYGTQQFHGPKTNIIAGWSEKIFDFILLAEEGEGNLEKKISEYTW